MRTLALAKDGKTLVKSVAGYARQTTRYDDRGNPDTISTNDGIELSPAANE